MGKIFCLMGKSASGKDYVYRTLLEENELQLKRVVPYTTRPIRVREVDGKDYFFLTDEEALEMERAGRVIETRSYDTACGLWKYISAYFGSSCLRSRESARERRSPSSTQMYRGTTFSAPK